MPSRSGVKGKGEALLQFLAEGAALHLAAAALLVSGKADKGGEEDADGDYVACNITSN